MKTNFVEKAIIQKHKTVCREKISNLEALNTWFAMNSNTFSMHSVYYFFDVSLQLHCETNLWQAPQQGIKSHLSCSSNIPWRIWCGRSNSAWKHKITWIMLSL